MWGTAHGPHSPNIILKSQRTLPTDTLTLTHLGVPGVRLLVEGARACGALHPGPHSPKIILLDHCTQPI